MSVYFIKRSQTNGIENYQNILYHMKVIFTDEINQYANMDEVLFTVFLKVGITDIEAFCL